MGKIVVIGVGNPYRRDDGVGPAVIDLLRDRRLVGVRLATSLGDTAELIELWSSASLAIVVDAMRAVAPRPGRVHRTVSSHGLPMGEAIELARALGRMPDRLEVYGIEVQETGHGHGLSPDVASSAIAVARRIAVEVKRACASPTPQK
ncbi:hydrogenase maturation protease [Catelliglobosispora koreensis]|uniref:hydrogenase maturation protease n=1 Tax=Catelliglobosispora koreensis TaxID=129052 RepID=UPI000375FF9C|nr:hydrogenase maturation protease [Catelliglobosispora koreensis]